MSVTLQASKREDFSRSYTKNLRDGGQVPAVVYGKENEPEAIAIDSMELIKVIREQGRNAALSLDIGSGNTVSVMFQDYQVDPLRDELIHVDFYKANMSEARDVSVPLRLEGEVSGEGILQQPLFELQVRAKPNDIPEEITTDISNLEIGDSITVADLPKDPNYELIDEPETTIATVLAPANEVSEEHAEEVEESGEETENQE